MVAKLILAPVVLAGCSLAPHLVERPRWLAEVEQSHGQLVPGKIIDLDDHRPIGFQDLLDRLEDKRIVYVGEIHNDMDHHDVQLKILEGLHDRDPRLVIGMEMFDRRFQTVTDQWTDGAIDQKTFLRESEWFSRWNFDFSLYEKILTFSRENGVRILALNAPRELVGKVGDFGIKALSPGERAMIAPIDTSDTLHRAYIQEVFKGPHKTPGKTFENFYEAQCVWEDTMAETISDFLTTQEGEDKKVIVFSGAGHIVYKFGIPMRAFRRTGAPYATILPSSLERLREGFSDKVERLSGPPADFVWITEARPREKVRLGVVVEKSLALEKGVVVRRVFKGSSAEKAGLQPGDTILSIDDETVHDMVDLRLALSRKAPGSTSRVAYLRDGKREEGEVTFSKKGFHSPSR